MVSACPKRKNRGIKATKMQARIGTLEQSLEDLGEETEMAPEDWEEHLPSVRAGAAKASATKSSVLITDNLFMNTKVNGLHCKVMIDNGATNNFINPECTRKSGLRTDSAVEIPINFVQGSTSSW